MILRITLFFMIALYSSNVMSQEAASDILYNSLLKAKAENKNVFIKYSASWCAWCKKMDENLNSENCKALFDSNYVVIRLNVLETESNKHLENPGAIDLLEEHKGEKAGLPFWVILNSDGILLEDSFNKDGENIGCPVHDEEVETFISILKNTSEMTDEELLKIAITFYSN